MSTDQRLPYFGTPPARTPVPANEVAALPGKRVVLSRPEGFVYDVRAVSAIHDDAEGREIIEVMPEEDYYRWMFSGLRRGTRTFPAYLVWVE